MVQVGQSLVIYRDIERLTNEIEKTTKDVAAKYRELHAALEKTSRIISKVVTLTPPEISRPSKSDLFGLLQLGRSVRGSGKKNTYDLLRWAPMSVAVLAAEFFENVLLRLVIAARCIFGAFLGLWS